MMQKNRLIILGVIIALVLLGAIAIVRSFQRTVASGDQQQTLSAPKDIQVIHKDFEFPIKDSSGTVSTTFTYTIQSAQLQDQIIVKGQKATAVTGRIFLIINLKLVNKSKNAIQINTRDYIRLGINGNNKDLLAPDIHNDPVEIQPISTEFTRIGFPVNAQDKSFTLYVGEIDGSKTTIPLKF